MEKNIIYGYTPTVSPMKLDIMVGNTFRETISIPCAVGVEYSISELKTLVRMMRSSLQNKEFDLFPCGKPKFRS